MKINLRESLNRLDLQTDNKYDLRNTYDCSKISDDKKRKLSEAIHNNKSAKQIYNLLNEDYDDDYDAKYNATYEANSYYGRDYRGLEDYLYTDDYSELEEWAWDKIQNGGYVEVFNRDSGKSVRLDPDKYDRESDDIYGILDDLRSVNESLNENNHKQLFKVVIQSGATKRDFESALYEDEAEEIVDYYGGRWIDENGFEWDMYVEEDDDSTEHTMIDNSYDMEDDDERAQRECVESLNESSDFAIDTFNSFSPEYAKLSAICILLNSMSPNKINYRVEDTYFDYGQDWKWTTIIAHRNNGDSWQAIYPAMQERILLAGDFDATNTAEFVNDPEFEEIAKDILRESRLDKGFNENLKEADYGGAYDIDPEMFWTKDNLIEFSDAVCDKLTEKLGYQYDIADVGAESNNDMYITIMDTTHDIEADVSFRIKMSRIRSPRDLMKYLDTVVSQFVKKFEEEYQYYDFDESLKEDIDDFDPKYDARYEVNSYYGNNYRGLEDDLHTSDFEEVKDWVWEKIQKGGYIEVSDRERGKSRRLDPDNYDWESDDAYRVFDDLEELSPLNEEYESNIDNSQYLDTNDLHRTVVSTELSSFLKSIEDGKSWDEALVNLGYECVDPGCTSWSKETEDGEIYVSFENLDDESTIENSKISFTMFDKNGDVVEEDSFDFRVNESLKEGLSDWEEETGFRHPMHNDFFDESLKESKDIEDTGYSVVLHYDDIGGGEECDYEASWDDVVEVLRDVAYSNGDGPEDLNEDEYLEWVIDNFDKLTDKYELNVLDYFEDSAREEYSDRYGDEYIKDSETGSWYRR